MTTNPIQPVGQSASPSTIAKSPSAASGTNAPGGHKSGSGAQVQAPNQAQDAVRTETLRLLTRVEEQVSKLRTAIETPTRFAQDERSDSQGQKQPPTRR